MSLRDALKAIHDEHGALTPRLVVDTARDTGHPLHSRFEWDDAVAGERYRLDQAQRLIQVVKVTYVDGKGESQSIRAYQSVRGRDGHTYVPSEDVAVDPVLTQIVLMDMRREWRAFKARYGHFAEFAHLVAGDLEEGAA